MRTQTSAEPRIAPRERLSDRVTVRLRPRHLDVALANGVPSETNAALALRARRLTRRSRRRQLAEGIRTVLSRAGSGSALRVGPLSGRVAAASDELERLAHALTQPRPVAPRGVAQALLLLTDGTGPLYNPGSAANVSERARTAAESLDLPEGAVSS